MLKDHTLRNHRGADMVRAAPLRRTLGLESATRQGGRVSYTGPLTWASLASEFAGTNRANAVVGASHDIARSSLD